MGIKTKALLSTIKIMAGVVMLLLFVFFIGDTIEQAIPDKYNWVVFPCGFLWLAFSTYKKELTELQKKKRRRHEYDPKNAMVAPPGSAGMS